jgi:hypothetical protein
MNSSPCPNLPKRRLQKNPTAADPSGVPDSFADHVADDLLEAYSLEALAEESLAYVEEHLLICEDCRARLQAIEEFVAGFQAVSQNRGASG